MRFHSFTRIGDRSRHLSWNTLLRHDSGAGLFILQKQLLDLWTFTDTLVWVDNLRAPDEPPAHDILFALFAGLEQHWLQYALLQAANPQGDPNDHSH